MIPRSTQRADRNENTLEPNSAGEPPPPARRRGAFVLGPALGALACVVAACTSGGGSSSTNTTASPANALIVQGLSAQQHGQTKQAVQDFTAALAKDPNNVTAHYDLGVIYQQYQNNARQAAAEYNKAISVSSNYKPALYNLALLETKSDPHGAVTLYNKLLVLNPKDPNVLFNLGLLLISLNDPVEGHADLKQAIALNPSLAGRVPAGVTP